MPDAGYYHQSPCRQAIECQFLDRFYGPQLDAIEGVQYLESQYAAFACMYELHYRIAGQHYTSMVSADEPVDKHEQTRQRLEGIIRKIAQGLNDGGKDER